MSIKAIVGVIIISILIGVLYVVFDKNFSGTPKLSNSKTSSAQELPKETAQGAAQASSSLITLPTPNPTPAPVDSTTDLSAEAEGLQMRDYSGLFEQLKDTLSK